MMIPWKFFVFLFVIGIVTNNAYAQEDGGGDPEIIAMGEDDTVGSPLHIFKGIGKLKLLGGIKKIKLKLASLGLKKGLLLAKLPLLGAANPFGGDGDGEESIDNYYVGTPDEDVGAHMWGSQQFDPNFHPENARYEMEEPPNPHWMHQQRYSHNDHPHVGSEHDTEYLPSYMEPNRGSNPEFYRSAPERPHPMSYHRPQRFSYDPRHVESFEFEGPQESRYKSTKVQNPSDDAYEAETDAHEQMIPGDMQQVYMKPVIAMTSDGMPTIPDPRYAQSDPQIMLRDASFQQFPQAQYVVEPAGKDMHYRHPTHVMQWQSARNSEMVGARNPESDNMSHIQMEEKNVNPVFMQEYVQAVKGFRHEPESLKAQNYFKKNTINEVKEKKILSAKDNNSKDCISDNTNEKCNNQDCIKSQEKENIDPVSRNAKELKDETQKTKLDVPIRRSIEDDINSQMVGYSNWQTMARFPQNIQSPQNTQSFNQPSPTASAPCFQGSIKVTDAEQHNIQPNVPTKIPKPVPVRMMSHQQMKNLEYGSAGPVGEREMDPQTPSRGPAMYQQYSETARLAVEKKPEIFMDYNPINAVLLPPDTAQPIQMFPAQMNSRANYAMQYSQDQETDLQYQQPNTDSQDSRAMVSDPNNPTSGYAMQYAPEQTPGNQYRTLTDNPASVGYGFDQAQYSAPAEGQQQQLPRMMMADHPEIQDEQGVGVMGPQVPEHGRTFHKKFLFGIKKSHKKGGYGYDSGNYYQSNYGSHGYSHSYYGHNYGYVGQQNPSETSSPQEAPQMQYTSAAEGNPMMTTDLDASASTNDKQEIVKPQESTCSCSKTWPEAAPNPQDDKRLYMGNPDTVGTPFTTILSRPYLGLWGPNAFLGPLFRPPSFFPDEPRFDDGPRDRFQRDSTLMEKMEKNLSLKPITTIKPAENVPVPGMRLKKALPRPYSGLLKDRPLFVKYVKADSECNKECKNTCEKDSSNANVTAKVEKINVGNNE